MASQLEELFEGSLGDEVNQNNRDLKWTKFLSSFHICVDKHMAHASARISDFCRVWDTNPAWSLWNSVLEEFFVEFAQIPTRAAKFHKGRGKPNLVPASVFKTGPCKTFNSNSFIKPVHQELSRLQAQVKRLEAWIARDSHLKVSGKRAACHQRLNSDAMALITKHHFSSRITERVWHDRLISLDKGHQRLLTLKTGLSMYISLS